MMHGPCVQNKDLAKCLNQGRCSKYFPKDFCKETTVDDDDYPTYMRRDNGHTVMMGNVSLDNRFVVPYNPTLLRKFQAHINVEKCNQSRAIKYLFKYISKGSDRVVMGFFDQGSNGQHPAIIDEVQQYVNCHYVSACEASWRVFGFPIHH